MPRKLRQFHRKQVALWLSSSSCGSFVKGLQPQNSLYSCGTVPDSHRIPHDYFPYIILYHPCIQDIKVIFLMYNIIFIKNIHFYNITILHILQYITKYNQYFCYLNAILTIYSLTFQNLRFNPACTASPLQAIIFEIILLMTKYEIPDVMHLSKKSCGNEKSIHNSFLIVHLPFLKYDMFWTSG